jgi:hypothetical protein
MDVLDPEKAMLAVKWDYFAQPTAIMSPVIGRISFALFLLTVCGPSRFRRWLMWVIIVTQFITGCICFMIIVFQCKPMESLWNPKVKGDCISLTVQEYNGYFQGGMPSPRPSSLIVSVH